ncbi:MAG TPA: UvrD-helicase domain-containing protein, partial [Thermoanaerobaculia bacterium]|nr:UvrD-helicase domain-containing protein [Thermoanaerobaculia bacterium]
MLACEGAVERATHLLSAVDRLHVQTIHGCCRSLLAAHPAEAGVHPAFVIDAEDAAADLLLAEVVEELLPARYAAGDPSLFALAGAGLGPAKLVEALRVLLAKGATAEELRGDPLAAERWQALLDRLAAAAADLAAVLSHLPPQGGALKKAREAQAVASVLAAGAAEGPDEAVLEELLAAAREAAKNLKKKLRDWTQEELTQTEAAHLGVVRSQLADAAGRVQRLLEHLAGLEPQLLAALRTALLPLLEEVEARRYRLGLVSFDELQRKAVRLLERHPPVARLVRGGIAQLLVDEFQDTDSLQCRLVETLALAAPPGERPGLLLVGDPKQSIYGWRRADLAAYEAFARRLEGRGGRVEALTVNFRSVPAILAEVERAMDPAFDPEPGLQPLFVPLVACPDKADAAGCTLGERAPVEHWLTWQAASGEPLPLSAHEATRLEARAIAADLASLRSEGGADAPAWSEIAILLRATGDLPYYLAALREAGVPYQVDSDRSFYRQREVIDAAALVRTVLDPGDQVAVVALLRSPWVGVPDAALLPLWVAGFPAAMAALTGPDPEALAGLRSLAKRAAAQSAASDAPGLAAASGWEVALEAAVEGLAALRAGYRSLTSDRFVDALRARFPVEALAAARFLGAHRLASLRRLFEQLVDDLERAGGDPAPVLRRLRRAVAEEMEEPKGLPRTSGDAVQVLTIHKAKGLDFRHVYLPQLHRGHGGDRKPDVWRGDREGGAEYSLLGIRSLGMDEVSRFAARTEEAERVRLLYVGMTRAKERLVTLGRWPGEPGGRALRRETLLQPLSEALGGYLPREELAAGAARDSSGVLWRVCGAIEALPPVPAGGEVSAFGGDPWAARERFA